MKVTSAVLAAFFVFTLGIIAGFLYTVNERANPPAMLGRIV